MRDDDKTDLTGWLGLRSVPDFSKARWLGPALSAVVIVLFGMAISVVFAVLGHALFDFGIDAPRIGFGTGAVAVALIGAPFVIWRSVVAQKTVNVTEQGHITDRINTAVQGLGAEKTVKRQRKRQTGKLAYATGEDDKPDYSQPIMEEVTQPNLEVRIGAIYALERIAQDSARDHVQIMEILCAYIRQNAPAPETDDWPELEMKDSEDEGPLEADWEKRLNTFRKKQNEKKATLKVREDIQTALTVIGRRTAKQRQLEAGHGVRVTFPFDTLCPNYVGPDDSHDKDTPDAYLEQLKAWKDDLEAYGGYRLNLRKTDLRGADLTNLNFNGASFSGVHFQGAVLLETRLKGAGLLQAQFEGAILMNAQMQGAHLWQAQLQVTTLKNASLQGANLMGARLQGTHLNYVRAEGANLDGARLQGALLDEARFQGALLDEARLQGANLGKARFHGTRLAGARIDGRTILTKASLRGTAVNRVDFTNVPDISAHLPDMFGDASVTLPGGVGPDNGDWPAHWPTFELGSDFFNQWRKWQADPENYPTPKPPDLDKSP